MSDTSETPSLNFVVPPYKVGDEFVHPGNQRKYAVTHIFVLLDGKMQFILTPVPDGHVAADVNKTFPGAEVAFARIADDPSMLAPGSPSGKPS